MISVTIRRFDWGRVKIVKIAFYGQIQEISSILSLILLDLATHYSLDRGEIQNI
jgi:hypothetical protein